VCFTFQGVTSVAGVFYFFAGISGIVGIVFWLMRVAYGRCGGYRSGPRAGYSLLQRRWPKGVIAVGFLGGMYVLLRILMLS
jgi:hypothetical protein